MKLECYPLSGCPPKLVAARAERAWMDDSEGRHAYRCLPLTIANAHGWELLCPVPIQLQWNGGPTQADLEVTPLRPLPENRGIDHLCKSHFAQLRSSIARAESGVAWLCDERVGAYCSRDIIRGHRSGTLISEAGHAQGERMRSDTRQLISHARNV